MLDSLNHYVYINISKYLEQKDRYNLFLTTKNLSSIYIKEFYKHHAFKYDETLNIDPDKYEYIYKITEFNFYPEKLLKFKNLKKLKFANRLNFPLDKTKLLNLGEIEIDGSYMNSEMPLPLKYLPKSLKKFKCRFIGPIKLSELPANLEELEILFLQGENMNENIVPNLKKMVIKSSVWIYHPNWIPNNLEYLEISNYSWHFGQEIKKNLKYLKIGSSLFMGREKLSLNNFATYFPNLEVLDISSLSNKKIDDPNMFPKTLKKLVLRIKLNKDDILPSVFPEGLEEIHLLRQYSKNKEFLSGVFPSTLKKLVIS